MTPDHVQTWLSDLERRYSPHTVRSYAGVLGRFSVYAKSAGMRPVDASPALCSEFLRVHYLTRTTQAQRHAALTSFFRFWYRRDEIARNPMEWVERPRLPNPADVDVRFVSSTEVQQLLDACRTTNERVCVGLFVYTGARRGAIAGLTWEDVDLEGGWIRLREKGDRLVTKPINRALRPILRAASRARPTPIPQVGPVIDPEGVQPYRAVRDILARVARRAGVNVHPHALRAAFAVRYLETHPGDLVALQGWLGHSSIKSTELYLRRLDRQRSMRRGLDLSYT